MLLRWHGGLAVLTTNTCTCSTELNSIHWTPNFLYDWFGPPFMIFSMFMCEIMHESVFLEGAGLPCTSCLPSIFISPSPHYFKKILGSCLVHSSYFYDIYIYIYTSVKNISIKIVRGCRVVPKLKKQGQQIMHTRQCQTNNISSEFRVHATTKVNYNSCMCADKE